MNHIPRALVSQAGFTIAELLVSMGIMLLVVAGLFSILSPAEGASRAQPEVSDMQQRMRIAVDVLVNDLIMAGAGVYSGSQARSAGPLSNVFAPIVPYRAGRLNPDVPGTFRSDTITVVYVPETAVQTTISAAILPGSNDLKVNVEPGCPSGDPLCGLQTGMQVVIFDSIGAMNTFAVAGVQGSAATLHRNGPDFAHSYEPLATIAQIRMCTYYLKSDDVADSSELMVYDGNQSDVPLVDDVVGLAFSTMATPSRQYRANRCPIQSVHGPPTGRSRRRRA